MIGGASKLIDSVRNYRNAIYGSGVGLIGSYARRFASIKIGHILRE